jgi:hypothetical protein
VVDHITWLGESGSCNSKRKLIRIARGLADEDAISTLLHEMAHAATQGNHGMPWKRKMIQLREAGAPLQEPDAKVGLDDWSGERVSRQWFYSAAQDMLAGLPEADLRKTIRWFISSYGGPASVRGFLSKYPWARHVFRRAKREDAALRRKNADFKRRLSATK